jgi:alkanesulfonate monooxygenase SsuD/methylene tetrahydromethanopterin reductase-like flavin-dependent oxidoreductase (luciferase family)
MTQNIQFDFSANPSGLLGVDDHSLYDTRMKVARLGHELGYQAVWVAEHHFTNYYATPSPLMALAQIAGECPGIGLGACVLVLPWYQPLRLASDIAMLSNMTDGHLYMGVGRGTAPMEHEAYGVPMEDAQGWFDDALAIMRKALDGGRFTYQGKHWSVEREVELRPRPRKDNITLYGPYANPSSARKYAEMGLPVLNAGYPEAAAQAANIKEWEKVTAEIGGDLSADRINWVPTLIAETDEEAFALARETMSRFFELQSSHYTVDSTRFENIKGYESWGALFANLKSLSDPEILDGVMDFLFVGSPSTVIEKIERHIEMGYNHFAVHADLYGLPFERIEQSMTMFAKEIAPHFSTGFGEKKQAAE